MVISIIFSQVVRRDGTSFIQQFPQQVLCHKGWKKQIYQFTLFTNLNTHLNFLQLNIYQFWQEMETSFITIGTEALWITGQYTIHAVPHRLTKGNRCQALGEPSTSDKRWMVQSDSWPTAFLSPQNIWATWWLTGRASRAHFFCDKLVIDF